MGSKIVFLIVFGFFLLLPTKLYAQTNIRDRIDNLQETRCEKVTNRIDQRIDKYLENQSNHLEKYNKIAQEIERIMVLLKNKNIDITLLKNDLEKLNTMRQTFADNFDKFILNLEETKDIACKRKSGDFLSTINQSRANLKLITKEGREIINFIRSDIKNDILELKKTLKN